MGGEGKGKRERKTERSKERQRVDEQPAFKMGWKRVHALPSLKRPSSLEEGKGSRSDVWTQEQKVKAGPGEGGLGC